MAAINSPNCSSLSGLVLLLAINIERGGIGFLGTPVTGERHGSAAQTLLVAMIAAWWNGAQSYLGQPLVGTCPPVVIFGPDMSRIRWMKLLSRFGLAERSTTGKWQLLGPIQGLFSKSEGIQLDDAGLARIADLASAHPGGLFIFDSYTKLTSKLGLKEGSNVYAGPAEDVQEVCAPHSITVVLLHHSGHSRQGEGAVAASRGTTALPAAFSQVINLTWFKRKENKADKRVLLETEGRGQGVQRLQGQRPQSPTASAIP